MAEEEVVEEPNKEAPQNEGDGGEQLILGRFKNQDEVTKAYQELEKKFTQTSQENATYRKQTEIREVFPPQQPTQPVQEQPVNTDELFWTNPVGTMERLLDSKLDYVYTQNYEAQKAAYASDPQFTQYEQQIDFIVKEQYPELKKQPGIVGQLYKMVRGLTFDEEAFRRKTIEEYELSKVSAAQSGIEGASASPSSLPITQKVELSDTEKRIATQFHPDLKPEEAWQKYADAKTKMRGVANG